MTAITLESMVMFDRSLDEARDAGRRLIAGYRRTGADVPFGDQLPSLAG